MAPRSPFVFNNILINNDIKLHWGVFLILVSVEEAMDVNRRWFFGKTRPPRMLHEEQAQAADLN